MFVTVRNIIDDLFVSFHFFDFACANDVEKWLQILQIKA